MSFWNTIVSAIIVAAVLETVRYFVGKKRKKSDLQQEFHIELVRKRLAAYENIAILLQSFSPAINEISLKNKNEDFVINKLKELEQLHKEIMSYTFFASSEFHMKLMEVNKIRYDLLRNPNKKQFVESLKLTHELLFIMRKEISEGVFDPYWGKASPSEIEDRMTKLIASIK